MREAALKRFKRAGFYCLMALVLVWLAVSTDSLVFAGLYVIIAIGQIPFIWIHGRTALQVNRSPQIMEGG